MKNIYVVIDHFKGQVEDISFEMLGKARELGNVTAILIGDKSLCSQLGAANKVLCIADSDLQQFNPQAYLSILNNILSDADVDLVMIGSSSSGLDLASGLSVSLDCPLLAYVTNIGDDFVTSQLYGGKMNVDSGLADKCIVSVLPGSFPASAGKIDGSPEIQNADSVDTSALQINFRRLIEPDGGDVDITSQEVLISVGRGIQKEDNIPMAEELASKLGGSVSCSRPIVDNKWLSKTRQVGKSGLKVKPKLYMALGISGAPEHIEGMKDADLIIAVNTDPDAPIFEYAHYGCTCDLFDLIPALNERL